MAVELADPQALHARHREQLVAEIDAEHVCARSLDLGAERPIAATEIEDALAWSRLEHGEDGAGKLLHETSVPSIIRRRPALHWLRRGGVGQTRALHSGCHGS